MQNNNSIPAANPAGSGGATSAPITTQHAGCPQYPTVEMLYDKVAQTMAEAYGKRAMEDPEKYIYDCMRDVELQVAQENAIRATGTKWRIKPTLQAAFVVEAMLASGKCARIELVPGDPEKDALAVYNDDPKGKWYGIYTLVGNPAKGGVLLGAYIEKFVPYPPDELQKAVYNALLRRAPYKEVTACPGVIPCKDGVFVRLAHAFEDNNVKTMLPMSDWTFYKWGDPHLDGLVFTWKIATEHGDEPYDPTEPAPEVDDPVWEAEHGGEKWTLPRWLRSLHADRDDPDGLAEYDMAHMANIVDANYKSDTMTFYANANGKGCGGKGTRQKLIENLIGEYLVSSKQLKDLTSEHGMSDLIEGCGKTYMVFSEMRTNDTIKGMDLLKPLVTHDRTRANPKFKSIVSKIIPLTVEMQANELPVPDDQSDSFWRRLAVVPSSISFTGKANKRIETHHIKDPATLRWLLRRLLYEYDFENKDIQEYITDEMQQAKREYASEVSPVWQFLDEYLGPDANGEMAYKVEILENSDGRAYGVTKNPEGHGVRLWDLYPVRYLYYAFLDYAKDRGHSEITQKTFTARMQRWAEKSPWWDWIEGCVHTDTYTANGYEIGGVDTLAATYGDFGGRLTTLLGKWYSTSKDPAKRLNYIESQTYNGLLIRNKDSKVVQMPQQRPTAKKTLAGMTREEKEALLAALQAELLAAAE